MVEYRKAPVPTLSGRIRRWVKSNLGTTIVGGIVAGVVVATIVYFVFGQGEGGHSTTVVRDKSEANGNSACSDANFGGFSGNVDCSLEITTVKGGLSKNPRARVVELTGSWSEQGFVDAIIERNTEIVALYLESGMDATTLHNGASAILFGFQGAPQNGDPVALVKAFQADGFQVDDQLQDNHLMDELTEGFLPLMFDTSLTPKGYTGGYWRGKFVGSLLFWIAQRATWAGPSVEDVEAMDYLIGEGADCEVPLSFLEFNRNALGGTRPYRELLSMMEGCA